MHSTTNTNACSAKAEIDAFMKGMYGKAAPIMSELLDFIANKQRNSGMALGAVPPNMRTYLDGAYFTKAFSLLGQAVAKVQDDSRRRANVEREFIPFQAALLRRFSRLTSEEREQFDYDAILESYAKMIIPSIDYYYPTKGDRRGFNASLKGQLKKNLLVFRESRKEVPVPKIFEGKRVIVMPYYKFTTSASVGVTILDEPESPFGKGIAKGKATPEKTKDGVTGFGIWDTDRKCPLASKDIRTDDIPKDEKFHIVHLGKVRFHNSSPYFWGTSTWQIQCKLDEIYEPTATNDENTYDAYFSVKFSGALYVPGSSSEEWIIVDALYFVQDK